MTIGINPMTIHLYLIRPRTLIRSAIGTTINASRDEKAIPAISPAKKASCDSRREPVDSEEVTNRRPKISKIRRAPNASERISDAASDAKGETKTIKATIDAASKPPK